MKPETKIMCWGALTGIVFGFMALLAGCALPQPAKTGVQTSALPPGDPARADRTISLGQNLSPPPAVVVAPPPGLLALDWDAVAGAAGYNVYYGEAPQCYQSRAWSATNGVVIRGLALGRRYYFAATAVTAAGMESDFSPELSGRVERFYFATPPVHGQLQTSPDLQHWTAARGTPLTPPGAQVDWFVQDQNLPTAFYRIATHP